MRQIFGRSSVVLGAWTLALFPAIAVATDPTGDYGDAPDCVNGLYRYPTRYATQHSRVGAPGVHHLNLGQETLGIYVSAEAGTHDPFDPDFQSNLGACVPLVEADRDGGFPLTGTDDGVRFWGGYPVPNAFFGPPLWAHFCEVQVYVDPAAPPGPRYLNILIDANADGEWANRGWINEWPVQNAEINVNPGQLITYWVPLGAYPQSFSSTWVRVTLSRTPVDEALFIDHDGWDGSGAFLYGETEDYYYVPTYYAQASPAQPVYAGGAPPPPDPPCPVYFSMECIPAGAGVGGHAPIFPWGTKGTIGWRVGSWVDPASPEACTYKFTAVKNGVHCVRGFGAWMIPNALIRVRPLPGGGVPIGRGPGVTNDDYLIDVGPRFDLQSVYLSRRVEATIEVDCCGEPQFLMQRSCCAILAPAAGNFFRWFWKFGFQKNLLFKPKLGAGVGVCAESETGTFLVQRIDDAPPSIDPNAPAIHKFWAVSGKFGGSVLGDDPNDPTDPNNLDPNGVYWVDPNTVTDPNAPLPVCPAFADPNSLFDPNAPLEPSTGRFSMLLFQFSDADLIAAGISPDAATKRELVVARLFTCNPGDGTWSTDVGERVVIKPQFNTALVIKPKAFGMFAIGLPEAFPQPGPIGGCGPGCGDSFGSADIDDDCDVDLTDLAIVLSDFDCTGGCVGDTNGDDEVDLTDLARVLTFFDASCP